MVENHREIEKSEIFSGMKFRRAHSVHTIRRANYWKRFYEPTHYVRVERESANWYHVYVRRK